MADTDTLDSILWDELGIDLNAHPKQKAKLEALIAAKERDARRAAEWRL